MNDLLRVVYIHLKLELQIARKPDVREIFGPMALSGTLPLMLTRDESSACYDKSHLRKQKMPASLSQRHRSDEYTFLET